MNFDGVSTEDMIKELNRRKKDWQNCKHGLYKVHWTDGGSSLASIGSLHNGERWIAPTNWTCELGENPTALLGDVVDSIISLDLLERE